MAKFATDKVCAYDPKNIKLKVYSISDTSDILLDNITSLIRNIKQTPINYKLSYTYTKYITRDYVKILCINTISSTSVNETKMFISLTNDINLLIECLFYAAINYGNVRSIEYIMDTYTNEWNINNLSHVCTECHIGPLKHILLNNYKNKLSLKHLACRKIGSVCNDIDKLQIPRELREYIKSANIIKEVFYNKDNGRYKFLHEYNNILRQYRNIANRRLFVKGIIEYNCTIHRTCGHTNGRGRGGRCEISDEDMEIEYFYENRGRNRGRGRGRGGRCEISDEDMEIEYFYNCRGRGGRRRYDNSDKKNYILYCELLSYDWDKDVYNDKYASFTFHQYEDMCSSGYVSCTLASMNCEILEQLPNDYNFIPKHPIYFSITADSFDYNMGINNEAFILSELGDDAYYPSGFYKIKLELFMKPHCTISNKRKIEDSNLLLRNLTYESPQTMQNYIEKKLKRYKK